MAEFAYKSFKIFGSKNINFHYRGSLHFFSIFGNFEVRIKIDSLCVNAYAYATRYMYPWLSIYEAFYFWVVNHRG